MGESAPKRIELIARGLLVRDGRVLLCRSTSGGYLYLPGGHVEPGEDSPTALAREYLEESGLRVRVGELLLVNETLFVTPRGKPHHELNLVFHVEPEAALRDDIRTLEPEVFEFEWVEQARLHDEPLLPRAIKAWMMSGAAGEGSGRPEWITVDERREMDRVPRSGGL